MPEKKSSGKYVTASSRESEKAVGQSFSPLVKQYHYNDATGELEELPDLLDVDKLIASHMSTSLESMLTRFMPEAPVSDDVVFDDHRELLDRLVDAQDAADTLCDELKLDPATPYSQIISAYERVQAETQAKVQAEAQAKAQAEAQAKAEREELLVQFEKFYKAKQEANNETSS